MTLQRNLMECHQAIVEWAIQELVSKEYFVHDVPEIVLETPWSHVLRITTTRGAVYLKQTPASTTFSLEPKVTQLLADKFHASVPQVIAAHDELHCFLMEDAGQSLRSYLKTEFQSDLMCQSIQQYTSIQRATERQVGSFIALGRHSTCTVRASYRPNRFFKG